MSLITNLARLILAYFIAAALSTSVSLSFYATAWASIWTYAALLGGLVLSTILIWAVLALMFGSGVLILALSESANRRKTRR